MPHRFEGHPSRAGSRDEFHSGRIPFFASLFFTALNHTPGQNLRSIPYQNENKYWLSEPTFASRFFHGIKPQVAAGARFKIRQF
jgi:hypothetical protein